MSHDTESGLRRFFRQRFRFSFNVHDFGRYAWRTSSSASLSRNCQVFKGGKVSHSLAARIHRESLENVCQSEFLSEVDRLKTDLPLSTSLVWGSKKETGGVDIKRNSKTRIFQIVLRGRRRSPEEVCPQAKRSACLNLTSLVPLNSFAHWITDITFHSLSLLLLFDQLVSLL